MPSPRHNPNPASNASEPVQDEAQRVIAEALRGLQFGSITLTVQDGVIVQIDRNEKRRLHR